jgi:hypothetical protein
MEGAIVIRLARAQEDERVREAIRMFGKIAVAAGLRAP